MASTRLERVATFTLGVALAMSSCSGYDVERLDNSADQRLSTIEHGDTISAGELLGLQDCDRVVFVGALTAAEQKEALIGDANVDLSWPGLYTVAVAFDGEDVLRAVRLGRVPLDLDWLASRTLSCETIIRSERGRAVVGSGE